MDWTRVNDSPGGCLDGLQAPESRPDVFMKYFMYAFIVHEAQYGCMSDSKHVQTELTEDEYEAFRAFVRERNLTVKEAGHEALVSWIERQRRADPQDRAFTVLDELEADELPDSAQTDARREPDLIDEWDGDEVDFKLATDLPVET